LLPLLLKSKGLSSQSAPIQTYSDASDLYKTSRTRSRESVVKQISIPETITALDNYPPLLRIPPEIRREILRYVLPSSTKRFRLYTDCDTTAINKKWNNQYRPHPDKITLDILRTNRLIYHECLSIMYSENLFHFYGFNYLPVLDFIRHLSPEAKSLVRKVRLTLLTDQHDEQPANHDVFCTVVHDFLPGLTTLQADPLVFF
jgi:hypothetical protein